MDNMTGTYQFIWYGRFVFASNSYLELAHEVYRFYVSSFGPALDAHLNEYVAEWSRDECAALHHGDTMNLAQLVYKGQTLDDQNRYYEFCNPTQWRKGPVRGISGGQGGGRYYRRIHTMAERRLNVLVLRDEGEPFVRGGRAWLPSSWDDIGRTRQKSWKVQGKRQKSWDKP